MSITRQKAEAHLAYLARRRERYAERKKQAVTEPEQLALFAAPAPRKPTKEEKAHIKQERINIGRAWIARIKENMR